MQNTDSKIYKRAAFSNGNMGGNDAGVAIVDAFPSDVDMLKIAADLGYSETVFSQKQSDGTFRTRYFSPENEVDFCGHATVALGAVLAELFGHQTFPLSLNKAEIDITVTPDGISTLTSPPTQRKELDDGLKDQILSAFSLSRDDLDPDLPISIGNAGVDHVVIPVKSREIVTQMDYDFAAMRTLMNEHQLITIALVYRESKKLLHVRNAFAYGGVVEDPATGAAAAAITGYLRDLGELEFVDGKATFEIHQGDDMGRPSRIQIVATATPGEGIKVGGTVRDIES